MPRGGLRRGPQGGVALGRAIADVVVVGGGPAGAAAAITLARAGRDVVVVDQATFPRDKCCGDGLTAGALRLLEALGLDPAVGAVVAARGRRRRALAVGARGRFPAAPWPRAVRRGRPAGRPRRRAARRGAAPRARRCSTATRCTGAVDRGDHIVARRRRHRHASPPATRSAPTACGRRCASPSACGRARLPRRVARVPPVLHRVSAAGPRTCSCGSSPTCCPATRGRSRCPDGRANVGFGIQRGGKVAHRQDMKDAVARAARSARTPRRARRPAPRPRRPHKAWPIPAAHRRRRAHRRARACSSATPPPPPTR